MELKQLPEQTKGRSALQCVTLLLSHSFTGETSNTDTQDPMMS